MTLARLMVFLFLTYKVRLHWGWTPLAWFMALAVFS